MTLRKLAVLGPDGSVKTGQQFVIPTVMVMTRRCCQRFSTLPRLWQGAGAKSPVGNPGGLPRGRVNPLVWTATEGLVFGPGRADTGTFVCSGESWCPSGPGHRSTSTPVAGIPSRLEVTWYFVMPSHTKAQVLCDRRLMLFAVET